MLEQENIWDEWEEENRCRNYREWYQIGIIEGRMSWVKSILQMEKQYEKMLERGKNISKDIQKTHEIHSEILKSEKKQDIIRFMEKYPNLSKLQLAKRILWESEYWH